MFYRQVIETKNNTEKSRKTEENIDREANAAEKQIQRGETDTTKATKESTAGPSGMRKGKENINISNTKVTDESEDMNTTMTNILTERPSASDEMAETPGDYISLSNDPEPAIESQGKRKRQTKYTRNTASYSARRKLYKESEEEEPEGTRIDTPLLISMNEMMVKDVAAKAFLYIKIVEEIRIKSGRLQGALSGKMKRALESLKDAITSLNRKASETGDIEYLKSKNRIN